MDKKVALLLILIATVGAGGFVINQITIYDRVMSEIEQVKEETMLVESSNNEITSQLEYVGSLEFVEYIARTQLKYVMPDEIVFVEDQNYEE